MSSAYLLCTPRGQWFPTLCTSADLFGKNVGDQYGETSTSHRHTRALSTCWPEISDLSDMAIQHHVYSRSASTSVCSNMHHTNAPSWGGSRTSWRRLEAGLVLPAALGAWRRRSARGVRSWRRRSAHGVGSWRCLLLLATAPLAGDDAGARVRSRSDPIAFLFSIQGLRFLFCFVFRVLCPGKLDLFAILIVKEGFVCKKLDLTHIWTWHQTTS
jgi:hypothetical protein